MTKQQEKNPRVNPPPTAFETRSEERAQMRALRRERLQEKRSRRKNSRSRPSARPLPYREGGPQRWGEWTAPQETREALEPDQDIPPHIHRFFRRLHLATPRTFVSESIIVLNVVIFAVMLVYGVHLLTPQAAQLVEWGANYGPMTLSGQWWRLLTANFLHAGIFHLLINMWVLWDLREVAERLTGPVGFFVLYLFAGLMGSLASVFWNPTTPSVGASGAIFGVFGGLLSFVWVNRESIPREILQSLRSNAMMIFLLNLVISIGASNIDTAGHIGGLMAGLGAGSLLSQPVSEQMRKARIFRNLLLLGVASLVIAISWSLLPKEAGALMRFARLSEQIERSSFARFREASEAFQQKKIDPKRFAAILAKEILPPWQKMLDDAERIPLRYLNFEQEKRLQRVLRSFRYRSASWRALHLWLTTGEEQHLRASIEQKRLAEAALQDDPRAKHPDLFQSTTPTKRPEPSFPTTRQAAPSTSSAAIPLHRATSQPSSLRRP